MPAFVKGCREAAVSGGTRPHAVPNLAELPDVALCGAQVRAGFDPFDPDDEGSCPDCSRLVLVQLAASLGPDADDDDMVAAFEERKRLRQIQGGQQRAEASGDFAAAAALANDSGLNLVRRSAAHYQLSPVGKTGRWLLNLYPGNGRVYADPNRPRAPFLGLPKPWRLADAVRAAAEKMRR